jgi:hypothetical protein
MSMGADVGPLFSDTWAYGLRGSHSRRKEMHEQGSGWWLGGGAMPTSHWCGGAKSGAAVKEQRRVKGSKGVLHLDEAMSQGDKADCASHVGGAVHAV